jgi:hypothetical protein
MKKYTEKYKAWIHELRRKVAQRYADIVMYHLEDAYDERVFNYWMAQGLNLDAKMIEVYDIYLD